jgi:hypothetical protein
METPPGTSVPIRVRRAGQSLAASVDVVEKIRESGEPAGGVDGLAAGYRTPALDPSTARPVSRDGQDVLVEQIRKMEVEVNRLREMLQGR